jgi:hypothetical protein
MDRSTTLDANLLVSLTILLCNFGDQNLSKSPDRHASLYMDDCMLAHALRK